MEATNRRYMGMIQREKMMVNYENESPSTSHGPGWIATYPTCSNIWELLPKSPQSNSHHFKRSVVTWSWSLVSSRNSSVPSVLWQTFSNKHTFSLMYFPPWVSDFQLTPAFSQSTQRSQRLSRRLHCRLPPLWPSCLQETILEMPSMWESGNPMIH